MKHEEVIKIKALCLFQQDGNILASRGVNKLTNEVFYRLLGGNLNFGETSEVAIRREIEEELHSSIDNLKFVKVLENIFTHEDWRGHEIIFIYTGDLARTELYQQKTVHIVEDTYEFDAVWIPTNEVLSGKLTLYPVLDYQSLFLDIAH